MKLLPKDLLVFMLLYCNSTQDNEACILTVERDFSIASSLKMCGIHLSSAPNTDWTFIKLAPRFREIRFPPAHYLQGEVLQNTELYWWCSDQLGSFQKKQLVSLRRPLGTSPPRTSLKSNWTFLRLELRVGQLTRTIRNPTQNCWGAAGVWNGPRRRLFKLIFVKRLYF
jgi:hypothetical protein